MDTTDTRPALRVVRPGEPAGTDPTLTPGQTVDPEDYWARVQQLRADLAALRPAN